MSVLSFQRKVWAHYKKFGRHNLPWRKTNDLYKILVSEVMLQQTQVERVVPFYRTFLKKFPTMQKLAQAPLSEVLKSWQGLGYNRRAKMLHQAAKKYVEKKVSRLNLDTAELEELPGVGPYTARAVAAFAYNQDVVFVETNIRTAIIHHFFPKKLQVSDAEIMKVLTRALPYGNAREWYSALMDYGAFLKCSGVKLNAKSSHYTKQKIFKGSDREARGAILRTLAQSDSARWSEKRLLRVLGTARRVQVQKALAQLCAEELIVYRRGQYVLAP